MFAVFSAPTLHAPCIIISYDKIWYMALLVLGLDFKNLTAYGKEEAAVKACSSSPMPQQSLDGSFETIFKPSRLFLVLSVNWGPFCWVSKLGLDFWKHPCLPY